MANFDVAARTLIHLGAELITSDEIALYELIKNAFDARSPRVGIEVVVPIPVNIINSIASSLSNDSEQNLCDIKKTTIEKILSSKRDGLSNNVEKHIENIIILIDESTSISKIIELLKQINYITVSDSGTGMSEDMLKTVFLRIGTDFKTKGHDDNKPTLGNKGIGRLSMMRLGDSAEVTTWIEKSDNANQILFDWKEFNKPDKSLFDITFSINKISCPEGLSGTIIKISNLRSDWDKNKIEDGIVNKFLRRLQNPFKDIGDSSENPNDKATNFPIDIKLNGKRRIPIKPLDKDLISLVDRVLDLSFYPDKAKVGIDAILTSSIRIPNIANSLRAQTRTANDVCHKLDTNIEFLKKLGPFNLTIHWYNRKKLTQKGLGKELKPMKKELDSWVGGIAIYRDDFRIGLTGSEKDGDWLDIDSQAFRGRGFTVNRIQTIGALSISKDKNPYLIDRSNREGLIHADETELLKRVLVDFGIEYLREQIQVEYHIENKEREAELLEQGTDTIEDRLKTVAQNINSIKSKSSPELKREVNELDKNLQFIANHVSKFHDAVSELKEKREDILELAGVGTVMHSIMHELARTTSQTRSLLGEVSKTADSRTKDLLIKLESEIKAINTRLKQLDPLSPNGRQRKEVFDIVKLTRTILSGYENRFNRHNIKFHLTIDNSIDITPVKVKMVKGFYSLAIENLLTNSIYWLKVGPLCSGSDSASIYIDIDSISSTVSFSDTGPGISPPDRDRVFNPGFSLSKSGNGFGLYIAKEVANHHGAEIYLDNSSDADGNMRTFILELPKE